MKKDFEALLEFFTDSDSHPRRTADGSKHISADTQEMISNIRVQVKFFEEMFFESWWVLGTQSSRCPRHFVVFC